MGMSSAAAAAVLSLILENASWAGVGDSTGLVGSTVAGHVYVSLHTDDPGADGDQTTNEVAFTGYARLAIVRSGGIWTIGGAPVTATNIGLLTFDACTAGSADATYAAIGTDPTGAGEIIASGALGSLLPIVANVVPTIQPGALIAMAA